MKLAGSLVIVGSLVVGCASSNGGETEAAMSTVTAQTPRPSDKTKVVENISRVLRNGPSTPAQPAYAFLHVWDDQVANTHGAGGGIGNVNFNECSEEIPSNEGARCLVVHPCANQPAPPPEQWFDVGPITVKTAIDTMEMTFQNSFYHTETLPGPGWRGDGDMIRVSFAGKAGSVPPFDFEGLAPVADATSILPTAPVPRTSPLHVEWSYGASSADSATQMVVIVSQGAQDAACVIPIAARHVDLPTALLHAFDVGEASLYLTTNRSSVHIPVVVDNLIATPSFQAEVDVNGHDGKIHLE